MTKGMTNADRAVAVRKISAAFWHRTRRQFVPLTKAEVALRSGVDEEQLGYVLKHMTLGGLVSGTQKNSGVQNVSIYELTPKGIDRAFSKKEASA